MATNKTSKKIRILHINGAYGKGGAAQVMDDISRHISALDSGISSSFMVGRDYSSGKKACELLSKTQFLCNVFYTRLTGKDCFGLPFSKPSAIEKHIAENCDIIHLHNLHGYYFNLNDIDLFKTKPCIWTVHDFWLNTSRVCYYDEKNFDYETGKYYKLSEYPKSWFLNRGVSISHNKRKLIKSLSDHIVFVAVSEYTKKEIQRVYPNLNIQVIHNGIDTDTFKPHKNSESGPSGNFKIVAMASDFKDERKGFLTLIKVLSILANKDIKNRFFIELIGNLHLPFNYRHLTRGITMKVHGYLNEKEDIVKILSQANLFVNLSRNETFCLSNVEAMACGTPVLLLENEINREIVGDAGVYLNTNNPSDVADFLSNIINHKIILPGSEMLRERGLHFKIDNCANAYRNLYRTKAN